MKFKTKAKKTIKIFGIELKKSLVTATIAALGFLIALSWRDVITEWLGRFSEASPLKNSFISAILVTIIAVIGIVIISKWNEKKKQH